MTLRVFAPAKVNLSLCVGQLKSDGRHALDSLVVFTRTYGDGLHFEQARELALNIDGPFAESLSHQSDNLVLRAASRLREHNAISSGAIITLTKSLPIASGIGGGSADAAATLKGLNELWGLGVGYSALAHLAESLGSDVPACVLGQALRMTGAGEILQAVPSMPKMGIVLVNPLVPCATGPVFARYDALGSKNNVAYEALPDLSTTAMLLTYLYEMPNDLEPAAIAMVPQIGRILEAIGGTPDVLLARMSGSGATCFGLYANLAQATIAAQALRNQIASSPIWVEADEIN